MKEGAKERGDSERVRIRENNSSTGGPKESGRKNRARRKKQIDRVRWNGKKKGLEIEER